MSGLTGFSLPTAQSMGAVLLSGFGVLALLLVALGIGGVVAFSVSRQHRDIGIRMALGARGGQAATISAG